MKPAILEQKKKYIAGYINHLKEQIKEYGESTPDFIPTANKRIKAFENCLSAKTCTGCFMEKSCGYSHKK